MVIKAGDLSEEASLVQKKCLELKKEIQKVLFGQDNLIDRLIIGLLTEGHLLLEGNPGLGKTLAIKTLSEAIAAKYQRIQFTPDLLPADLIGTEVYNPQKQTFGVKKGPIFTEILLADEINRAPAKVQSALLEVMAEKQVTLAGQTHPFDPFFMVLATQNPLEQEGTYPLPEAQVDRFLMKIKIEYPSSDEELMIMQKYTSSTSFTSINPLIDVPFIGQMKDLVKKIYVDEKIMAYILKLVQKTRHTPKWLDFGASPRASMALLSTARAHAFLAGRGYVIPEDVKALAHDVLRHRVRPSYEAEAEGKNADDVINTLLTDTPIP